MTTSMTPGTLGFRTRTGGKTWRSNDKARVERTLSTAVHALKALEFIAQKPRGATVKSVARNLGISLSSAYSLMNSLRSEGFVEDAAAGRGLYVLGSRIVPLYHAWLVANTQPESFRSLLEELRDRTAARAYVARWREGHLEVAEIVGKRGQGELADVSKDFRNAAHALALGKIFLGELVEDEWPSYLRQPLYKPFTRNTFRNRSGLRHNLSAVRARGVAFDLEEYKENVSCVAAPVKDPTGRLVAAIGISVPAKRLKNQSSGLVRAVRQAAREASDSLARVLAEPDIY